MKYYGQKSLIPVYKLRLRNYVNDLDPPIKSRVFILPEEENCLKSLISDFSEKIFSASKKVGVTQRNRL